MVVFDREKSILDGIFGDKAIIREKEITLSDDKDLTIKEFFDCKLMEFIKENSYYFYLPDDDAPSGESAYFMRNDKLTEQYLFLDEAVKGFFNNEPSDYAEYCILKRYKNDCDKW